MSVLLHALHYFYSFFLSFFIFSTLQGLWGLSSLTRHWTWAMAVKASSPNHWSAREFPIISVLDLDISYNERCLFQSACLINSHNIIMWLDNFHKNVSSAFWYERESIWPLREFLIEKVDLNTYAHIPMESSSSKECVMVSNHRHFCVFMPSSLELFWTSVTIEPSYSSTAGIFGLSKQH